jgi:outer membrane protein OmpA-like peptidoglycan-associated protein
MNHMKHCSAVIIFLFSSITLLAQYNPEKVNKRAQRYYEQARESVENGDFNQSITFLKQAVKADPKYADAWLSLAGVHFELKQYDAAIEHYEKAKSLDTAYFKDYNLPYSINLAGKGLFERALAAVNDFLTIPNLNEASRKAAEYRKATYTFAVNYARNQKATDYKFEPQNLGERVNSEFSEYFPTITLDGKELVFTRRLNYVNEDFYGAVKDKGTWTTAKGLSGNINTNQNEGAQNISQDGRWMIFTGCDFPEGFGSCDLYISYLTPQGWSTPENLGNRINTQAWESAPSLSPDKRNLYFSSGRPDGYGGKDIYVSNLLPNGKWSEPINLGPEINTAGNESYPFIHADNQTLYFTSNGHPGYGGDDLFLARKGAGGKWSKPENLGYPINTIEEESTLVIAADGKTAYYASNRSDSRGGLDLYSFELRSDVRPVKTLWVKGKVFDKKTKKGLPSAVELTDISTKETISRLQTDEMGNYLITLPVGRDYAFNVNRKGYLFYSENFPLSQKNPDSTYNIDIPLQPLEADAIIVLRNVFFDLNKYDVKPESQVELLNVVQLLKENPTLRIQINGHTDNIGKPADNLLLSKNRAQSVITFLTQNGIPAQRLTYKGFGDTQPVADNKTEEGRAQNRRTELKVLGQ